MLFRSRPDLKTRSSTSRDGAPHHACTPPPTSELVSWLPPPAAPRKEQSLSHPRRAGLPGTLCFRERPCRTGQENQVSGAETSSSPLGPHLLQEGRPDPTDVVTNNAVGLWQQARRTQRSPDEKPPTPTQSGHGLSIKQHQPRKAAASGNRLDNRRL